MLRVFLFGWKKMFIWVKWWINEIINNINFNLFNETHIRKYLFNKFNEKKEEE